MAETPAQILDLDATRGRLHALAGAGLLDAQELERALTEAGRRPGPGSWSRYLYRQALLVGVALVVAGAIFFVAANWSALSGFARMAIVGGVMVAATLVGGYLGDSLAGRAASALGGLMFGPLIAVYGQVYQTGADGWELFAWWTLVLVAYAALTRFAGTWALALLCAHITYLTYADQELGFGVDDVEGAHLAAALAVLDIVVVTIAELFAEGPVLRVLRLQAGFFGLIALLPFGVMVVVGEPAEGGIPAVVLLGASLVTIWLLYRTRLPDIGMLAGFATVVTILVSSFLGNLLFEIADDPLMIALLGLAVCAQVWGLTRWLLAWRREHPAEQSEADTDEAEPEAEPDASGVRARLASWRPTAKLETLRAVLAVAAPARLTAFEAEPGPLGEALHDDEGHDAPLLVRLFTAGGTWLGAGLIATLFAALELHESIPLSLILAVALLVGAGIFSRRPQRSLALSQLIWAMGVSVHALVIGALGEAGVDDTPLAATWLVLAIVTLVVVRVPSFQLVAALCSVGLATWLAASLDLPMFSLWVALPVSALVTVVWIHEAKLASRLGRTWSALAYGLPLGVAGPVTLTGFDDDLGLVAQGWAGPVATLVLVGLVGLVMFQARRERESSLDHRAYALGAVALVAGLAARHVPGLSLALLVLLVAHLRKSGPLQIIATIQLAGFLVLFYYQLETSLLLKSLWVLSTGAVLLVGALLARPRPEGHTRVEHQSRWLPALGLVALTCGIVGGSSVHKERILATGETVLLPLAPVDPRSLMQGDYMELRYEIEDEIGTGLFDQPPPGFPRNGTLIVARDDDGVGHFVRLDDGQPLAEDELRLEYRLRGGWGGWLRLGAESFLFEEGTGEVYEDARYGEIVVASKGASILVGLCDEQRQPLGLRLH